MLRSKGFINFAFVTAAALAVAFMFFACGEKASEPNAVVATEDVQVQVTAATIPILFSTTLAFDSGISELGMTGATSLKFATNDTNAALPLFNVKSATDSMSGTTTFGSCIFKIAKSTKATGLYSVGTTVEVSPCEVTLATSGKSVASNLTNLDASFKLGGDRSSFTGTVFSVNISDSGEVLLTVNGQAPINLGTVDIGELTGAN